MAVTEPRRRTPFADEHEAFRESFRRFLEREVTPAYPGWREQGIPLELFAQLAEHQFAAAAVPEERGGAGIEDFRFGAVLAEEAMRAGAAGLALMLLSSNDVSIPLLAAFGEGPERDAALEHLAAGASPAAFADPERPLSATPGKDSVVIEGRAAGVVNAGMAEHVIAVAAAGEDTAPVVALVGTGARGVERTASAPLVGPAPLDRADLRFDAVEVPASAVLAGDAARALERARLAQRLGVAAICVAGARAALAETNAYVRERRAFGRPIAEFENTRFALAQMSAQTDAVEAFVDACVLAHADGALPAPRCAAGKLEASELFGRVVDWGVQLHGGYGYMLEYPIAHAFTAARFLRLHGGTSEEMKRIVAESIGL